MPFFLLRKALNSLGKRYYLTSGYSQNYLKLLNTKWLVQEVFQYNKIEPILQHKRIPVQHDLQNQSWNGYLRNPFYVYSSPGICLDYIWTPTSQFCLVTLLRLSCTLCCCNQLISEFLWAYNLRAVQPGCLLYNLVIFSKANSHCLTYYCFLLSFLSSNLDSITSKVRSPLRFWTPYTKALKCAAAIPFSHRVMDSNRSCDTTGKWHHSLSPDHLHRALY